MSACGARFTRGRRIRQRIQFDFHCAEQFGERSILTLQIFNPVFKRFDLVSQFSTGLRCGGWIIRMVSQHRAKVT